MRRTEPFLLFGEDTLLLFALFWGGISSFLTSFGLEGEPTALALGLALLALLAAGLYRLPAPWAPLLPLALTFPLAGVMWLLRDALLPAWAAVQCAVVNTYAEVFPAIGAIMPVMELTDAQWAQEAPAKLFLRLPRNLLEDATARLALHPGSVPVYLHIPAEKLTLLSPRTSWCDGSPACLDRLRELLGAGNVKLTEK